MFTVLLFQIDGKLVAAGYSFNGVSSNIFALEARILSAVCTVADELGLGSPNKKNGEAEASPALQLVMLFFLTSY